MGGDRSRTEPHPGYQACERCDAVGLVETFQSSFVQMIHRSQAHRVSTLDCARARKTAGCVGVLEIGGIAMVSFLLFVCVLPMDGFCVELI